VPRHSPTDFTGPERIETIAVRELARLPVGEPVSLRRLMGRVIRPLAPKRRGPLAPSGAGRHRQERRTTAIVFAWAGERLSRHPEVQRRLVAELDEGGNAYLEAVIWETVRTRLAEPFGIGGGAAEIWSDPLAFRPERFFEGPPPLVAVAPAHEVRIVLRLLLHRFGLEPAGSSEEELRFFGASQAPSRGGQVVLRRRTDGPGSVALRPELWPGLVFSS
jgi:hypothetical protein